MAALGCRGEVSDPVLIFAEANTAYEAGDFARAEGLYRQLLPEQQSAAVYYNLGNAEYQQGEYGQAVLAYAKAQALDPGNPDIRANLKLVRDTAQVNVPALNWAEKLGLAWPVNRWAWLATLSFWATVALVFLPRLWGWRGPLLRAVTVFLGVFFVVCTVALSGYHRLGKMGVAIAEDVALKLSPTTSAPAQDFLKPGETAFIQRRHGAFFYIEADGGKTGWVSAEDFVPVWD